MGCYGQPHPHRFHPRNRRSAIILEVALTPVVVYLVAALLLRAWNAGRIYSFSDQAHTSRFLGAALLGGGLAAALARRECCAPAPSSPLKFPKPGFTG